MSLRLSHPSYLALLLLGSLLAVNCAGAARSTEAPANLEPLEQFVPVISATGEVVPVRWALIGSPSSGIVAELPVSEGELVQSGQLLASIGGREAQEAMLAAAELELASAQQALQDLQEDAGVQASQALLELANARDVLEDAERNWRNQQEGQRANRVSVRAAEAELALAEEAMERLDRKNYDGYSGYPEGDTDEAQGYKEYAAAYQRYQAALRNLNWYTGHPNVVEQAVLDAEVSMAEARVQAAEREWEKRKDGPAADELRLAEARLSNAQAQLAAAEAALADLEIRAPFAGTISELHIRQGEWLVIGSPVLLLADLEGLRVETTDLNELDVARIEPGDVASVTFDALPEVVVTGTVVSIAPKAAAGAGVNYTVVIELAEIPSPLRWAMTAFVDIEVQP